MRRCATLVVLALLSLCFLSSSHAVDRAALQWMRSKPAIDSVVVTGNHYFKASRITKHMYSKKRTPWRAIKGDRRARLQRETYGRDTLEIKYLYLSNGFLGIQVEERFEALPDSSALVWVAVNEGRRFFYGDSHLTGSFENRVASDLTKISRRQKPGKPVNLFDLHNSAIDMKTVLANEGYPYAVVNFVLDTMGDASRTDVTFRIDSDSLVYFGGVNVTGLNHYPEKVARRELKIEPGAIYRRNDIVDSQRRLVESGYFSTFQLRRADTLVSRLRPDFVLRVRERKPLYLAVRTGVGQSEVRDLTWDFSAGFGKRNFLGSRRLDLRSQHTFGVGRHTRLLNHAYRARFTEPWFLGIRMPLSLTGTWEPAVKDAVQDYRIETWSVALSTYKYFGTEIKTGLGAEYEEVNIFGVPEDQIELKKEQEGISERRKLYATFRRDSRDDLFIPRKGSVTDLSMDYVGGFLGGDEHFYKWEANWSSYQEAWPGWIAATRFRVGYARAFGESKTVPINDRFYLGGANTVRGFKVNSLGPLRDGNPLGANFIVVFNQEFRWRTLQVFQVIPVLSDLLRSFPLWQSIFVDIGNGFMHSSELKLDALAYTYGTGLQIVSPAGPIRVDYARRIKTDKIDFDDRWHFTILYAF